LKATHARVSILYSIQHVGYLKLAEPWFIVVAFKSIWAGVQI